MLEFHFSNLLALRQEVIENLHQISVDEDNIHNQLILPVPNINIIVHQIVILKDRNEQILQYLQTAKR